VTTDVEGTLVELLARQPKVSSSQLADAAGVSRQAAHALLARLVGSGTLVREGHARATRYRRCHQGGAQSAGASGQGGRREGRGERDSGTSRRYALAGLEEDAVWDELDDDPALKATNSNAKEALRYAFTELLNNAIDHSDSANAEVTLFSEAECVGFEIRDFGVGAFNRIQTGVGLDSPAEALEELSKGKLTTQPERHTGEGIFFSSKIADRFALEANGLTWTVDNDLDDYAIAQAPPLEGTRVRFEIRRDSARSLQALFDEYTEDFQFSKTRAHVRLFEYGVRFVSRSEAKRLLRRLETFSSVVLDFAGVDGIGQGFADEVFRVWARAHPDVTLEMVNANEVIARMVRRAAPEM
jgi:anti-sigma regulatory factor (Ser/Thr protein kinase)